MCLGKQRSSDIPVLIGEGLSWNVALLSECGWSGWSSDISVLKGEGLVWNITTLDDVFCRQRKRSPDITCSEGFGGLGWGVGACMEYCITG